jgi:hypothetical protein
VGEIPRQRGRNGKQNVKGGAQEASAIPATPRACRRFDHDLRVTASSMPGVSVRMWRLRPLDRRRGALVTGANASPRKIWNVTNNLRHLESAGIRLTRGGEHCRRAVGSSGDSATAATKDAGREEPIAPPRLAFTRSSQVRRYSLELEFYSWTLPNRQASRETRLANAP